MMISSELKSTVDTLTPQERHELAAYITRIEIENNPEYWKSVNERLSDDNPSHWVEAKDL